MMSSCQVAVAIKLHDAVGCPLPSVPSSPLLPPQPELRDIRPGRIAVLCVVCSLPDVRGVLQLGQSAAERTALHGWHAWALSKDALSYVTWLNRSGAAASLPGMSSLKRSHLSLPLRLPCHRPSTVACTRLGAPTWLGLNIIAWGLVSKLHCVATDWFRPPMPPCLTTRRCPPC